jgi:hypothetical protein
MHPRAVSPQRLVTLLTRSRGIELAHNSFGCMVLRQFGERESEPRRLNISRPWVLPGTIITCD